MLQSCKVTYCHGSIHPTPPHSTFTSTRWCYLHLCWSSIHFEKLLLKYRPKCVHQPVLSQTIPSNIVLIINMKNILWCVHEKYSMIFPWQIFYDISMKNILWYVHDKYFMNVCPWKILNNISIKHILWYVHNNFVKSFESAHSIKYSTGVAEPMGKKFHIITCNGAFCQKKGNIVLQFWVLYWFFIDSIMFDRNCICGNKSPLPPRETTSSEASQTLGFHPSRSNVLVFCKNISKAFASGPSASQQPENLEWQTIHKYNFFDCMTFWYISCFFLLKLVWFFVIPHPEVVTKPSCSNLL